MNAITLKTQCIGRLLVDLPYKAPLDWSQNIGRDAVARMPRVNSQGALWKIIDQRKAELELAPHRTEKHLLSDFRKINPNTALLMYRDSDVDKYTYHIDRYLWLETSAYLFKAEIANEEQSLVGKLSEVPALLKRIINDGSVREAGFCIDGALIAGRVEGAVNVAVNLNVPGWKGVSISVMTGEGNQPTNYDKDAYDLLNGDEERFQEVQRIARSQGDPAGEAPVSFDVIRKRDRVINGVVGQETVSKFVFKGGVVQHRFLWDVAYKGQQDTAAKPGIWVGMKTGEELPTPDGGSAPSHETPPESELLALWDAMLNSLRFRPGAL